MKNHLKHTATCMARAFITGAGLALSAAIAMPAFAQISFQQVFESPDNAQLNLDYAKQEAAAGNLLQAASTLERLLYADPNWDSARLFYTDVLFQLDDPQGANRELRLLEGRPLTPMQRADLARMSTVVTGAPTSSPHGGFSGRIKVGARYDDNGANALAERLIAPKCLKRDLGLEIITKSSAFAHVVLLLERIINTP